MSETPTPVDAGPSIDVERMTQDHERFKQMYSEHDPASLYYRRPDLAQAKRAELDLQFQSMIARSGATAAPPRTPESIAQEKHTADWSFLNTLPAFVTELAASADAAAATMSADAKEAAVAQIQKEIGEQQYTRLAQSKFTMPDTPKAHFVATYGAMRYAELVKQAEAALPPGQKLNAGALYDGTLLVNMAVHGRAVAARNAERAKMRK
jgi:hypothetical protein